MNNTANKEIVMNNTANKEIVMNNTANKETVMNNTANKETVMNTVTFKNDVHELLCTEKWKNIFNKYEALNDNDKAVWEMWYIRKTAITHLTKLNNYTTVEELRNSLNIMFNLIVDEVMPKIIENKVAADEKRISKENAKKERDAEREEKRIARENAKKERADKTVKVNAKKESKSKIAALLTKITPVSDNIHESAE